jgi:hypothetical protein
LVASVSYAPPIGHCECRLRMEVHGHCRRRFLHSLSTTACWRWRPCSTYRILLRALSSQRRTSPASTRDNFQRTAILRERVGARCVVWSVLLLTPMSAWLFSLQHAQFQQHMSYGGMPPPTSVPMAMGGKQTHPQVMQATAGPYQQQSTATRVPMLLYEQPPAQTALPVPQQPTAMAQVQHGPPAMMQQHQFVQPQFQQPHQMQQMQQFAAQTSYAPQPMGVQHSFMRNRLTLVCVRLALDLRWAALKRFSSLKRHGF